MATLTGLSSQSSLYSLVSQMSQIYQQPVLKLEQQRDNYEVLNGVLTDVKTKLSDLRTMAEELADTINPPLLARTVNTGDATVVTATATESSSLGSHKIKVSQLAKSHSMVSNQLTSADTSIATALGAGDYTFSITSGEISKEVTVNIAADDNDAEILSNVAYAINSAFADEDDPVTATALSTSSTTSKLIIKSGLTGTENKLEMDDVTGSLLAQIGIGDESVASTDTTGGYIYPDSELDAMFEVDGVTITRSENILDDVLSGVTLTLTGAQEESDSPVEINVVPDKTAIRAKIDEFIELYNDAMEYIDVKTTVDAETGDRGILASKQMYRTLTSTMRIAMADIVSTTGSDEIRMLADIGIEEDGSGQLSVKDSTELDDAIDANMNAIDLLFRSFSTTLDEMLKPFTKTGGYLDTDTTAMTSKIDSMEEAIERAEKRATAKEQRLIKQYAKAQELQSLYSSYANYFSQYSY